MENYQAFLARINFFETSEIYFGKEPFVTNPSVSQKVDEQNKFRKFYGDTVVFNLDETTKRKISTYVEHLYQTACECFCEKLDTSTFHMTLHDLSNSPVLEDVAAQIFENEIKIAEIAKTIPPQTIRMKSKYIFNMVNTSLVLGLYPVNEEEYDKLMSLYRIFDSVKELHYPLTPHITLAYYNRNGFDTNAAQKLENIVQTLNRDSFEILLDTHNLYYQKFTGMNQYINIINLGK